MNPEDNNNITIDLSDTYGATASYITDYASDVSSISTDAVTISDGTFTIDTNSVDWISSISINDTRISPDEVERMCNEYPALERVWRNFKSVYDMTLQDWKGKIKAGEVDDEYPF